MEQEIATMENEGAPAVKVWASWDNPVATPERWLEVQRTVEAGMSMVEASKVFSISYDAIKKRAQRDEWITEKRLEATKAAISVPRQSPRVETALEAVASSLEGRRSRTILKLAEAAEKGIERFANANLEVENWQDAKIVADIAMKLHNVGQEGVHVNVLVGGDGGFDGPLVEIGAEGDIDLDDDDANDM